MRVVAGRAFMVAADVRPGSPTLGQVGHARGLGRRSVLFWAPASFARGFAALADTTEIEYFCTAAVQRARTRAGSAGTTRRWRSPWPVDEPHAVAQGRRRGLVRGLARPARIGRLRRSVRRLDAGGGSSRTPVPSIGARGATALAASDVHKLAPPRRAPGRHRGRAGPARLHMPRVRLGPRDPRPRARRLGRGRRSGDVRGDHRRRATSRIGGTILATGALVGRARAPENRRDAQLEVLQHAAPADERAADGREEVGRAVVEETAPDHRLPQRPGVRPRGPDDLVPIAFEGRVGAYEEVDLDLLRTTLGVGFTGWVGAARRAAAASTTRTSTRVARRSPAPTTSTNRCSSSRCATTTRSSA